MLIDRQDADFYNAARVGVPERIGRAFEYDVKNRKCATSSLQAFKATLHVAMNSFFAARRIFWIQLVITLSAAGIAGLVTGVRAAVSAGAGGGISVFVTAVFACLSFAAGPGASAAKVARALYLGEVVKFLLTGTLFAGALIAFDVAFLPFILTYVATLNAYWLALLLTLDAR